ncbi:butyrophilin subfamily 3 member A2-like isoform X1 [Acanthopagrus latus]|uniref:butyrophilin subfamily 3 member A2-like isoform X1 n=1 Tax=Acanthopagrus latus TaxID=8177 RepID=UPI00187C847C|nr:butyrophilin subfamily 3 member A2-like isoform X1 [Acanthopagrus latus]
MTTHSKEVSFSILSVSMVHLAIILLMLSFGGKSELICSHEPIVALVGEDVLLPCHLEPAVSANYETVVWTRPDLIPKYIHYHQDGRLLFEKQHPSYYLRTRLFMDELPRGNVSMKIFRVKISDAGRFFCKLPSMKEEDSIQLTVGAVSTPFIEVVTNNSEHVVLQCNSTGWYPEPEVFWLDGEGNLLSAGPTETVRGPDDLYTVSSRVTVEKRHSNSFTCRVQQNHTNQTREAQIHVPADFFKDQSSSHKIWILPVSGALIIIIITICIKRCKSHFHFPFVGWITQKLLNSTKLEQRMGHRRDTINCATHLDKGTDPGFFLLHSLVKLFTVMENNFTNLLMILSRIYRRSFANDVVVQRLACLQ